MSTRISVIIPTRERARYLFESLKTVTKIDDANIEIVISDNASVDNTKEIVENAKDNRIRYFNTGTRVSMRENFEFALEHSTGDYIIFFGDDDGLIPGQFAMLRDLIEREKPNAVSWYLPTFGWPTDPKNSKEGGVRLLRKGCYGAPLKVDNQKIKQQLSDGDLGDGAVYPRLYHGCMSRAYLTRITGERNPVFRARSPDIYISFRAIQHGGDFWHVPHPFSINGFSIASTGGSMARLSNEKDKNATSFLDEIKLDTVEDVIPVTQSMALAFLGTLETARVLYTEDKLEPNYIAWYCLVLRDASKKDPKTAKSIMDSLLKHANQFGQKGAYSKAIKLGASNAKTLRSSIMKSFNKIHSIRGFARIDDKTTIATAAEMCDRILQNYGQKTQDGSMRREAAWKTSKINFQKYKEKAER